MEEDLEFWHNSDVKYISKIEFSKEFKETFGNVSISKEIDELEKKIEHLDNFDVKLPEDKQKEIEHFKEKLQAKRDRLKELINRAEIYKKDADNYYD